MRQKSTKLEPEIEGMDLHRHVRIWVRMSLDEKRKFEKEAKINYTNLSEYVRQSLHRTADAAAKARAEAKTPETVQAG